MNIPDWDSYFMTMAYLCSTRSKDQSSKVGAVIVGPDHEVRSTGYNSFPRHLDDGDPARQERPEKYSWFEHAERNSIYNASLVGIPVKGCRMYTPGIPCADCARAVIQSGIVEVVTDHGWDSVDNRPEWAESLQRSLRMFEEAGVAHRIWRGDLVPVVKFQRGKTL